MLTHLSHKIRLYPTREQEEYFSRCAGAARKIWNWALAEWNRQYEAGEKPNALALKKQFNAMKHEDPEWRDWISDIHSKAQEQAFRDIGTAWSLYFKSVKKATTGNWKQPRFKSRDKCTSSFYVAGRSVHLDEKRMRFSRKVGWVKMAEAVRLDGTVMSARITRKAGRWYASFSVEGEFSRERIGDGTVGVDVGLHSLIVTSDGDVTEPLKPLLGSMRRLKIRQRRLSRKQKGSNSRYRERQSVARLHARISNQRSRSIHEATKELCTNNEVIVIENLNVKGMVRNHKLARSLTDVSLGELHRQIEYKGKMYDGTVVQVDRWFPSSKTCSNCGHIFKGLTLKMRTWTCSECGTRHDRDLNAAKNLKAALKD